MRTVPEVLHEIRRHGERTYPEECCGFLLGEMAEGGNVVTAVSAVENAQSENRQRRYVITAEDYQAADRAARQSGLDIVGIYHSHPDHPARPSATDLAEATFPGYTYVIVSIQEGHADELTAWQLSPDRSRFERESIDEAATASAAQVDEKSF